MMIIGMMKINLHFCLMIPFIIASRSQTPRGLNHSLNTIMTYVPPLSHTHLFSASLQLGHVQAIRLFFSPGWLGSSRVRVWSTCRAGWPGVVASCRPPPCMVWTVRCCWPGRRRHQSQDDGRGSCHPVCLLSLRG